MSNKEAYWLERRSNEELESEARLFMALGGKLTLHQGYYGATLFNVTRFGNTMAKAIRSVCREYRCGARSATHKCTVCGSKWLWGDDEGWSPIASMNTCCDTIENLVRLHD